MFRLHKTLDVLTLFHAPKNAASTKILSALKAGQERAEASSDNKPLSSFELDVVEEPTVPTPSQLQSILEFVGKNKVGQIVKGAKSEFEAAKALEGPNASERVLRPLLVDWNNGRAVLGADEKAVDSLMESLPK